jgi:hypothetical protein
VSQWPRGSTEIAPAMRNVHVWKTKTPEGEKREIRAERFGGVWRLQAQIKGEAWTYYDSPLLEDLIELRDIVWRKYQRKRLPWTDVATLDEMIKQRGGVPPESEGEDENLA